MNQHRKQQIKHQESAAKLNLLLPLILIALFLFLFVKNAKSQVAYVNYAATGANNGSSWVNAYTSLHNAIASAVSGSQIWVAKGTYKPSAFPIGTSDGISSRNYAFSLKSNVSIYGGFEGHETTLLSRNISNNITILSGDLGVTSNPNDNCYHVVIADGTSNTAILDGFVINSGYADASTSTVHFGSGSLIVNYGGAGLYLNNAHPKITNCIIRNNDAVYAGGGVFANGRCDATFANCIINNNSQFNTPTFGGAGVYYQSSSASPSTPSFSNCLIYSNVSIGGGAGIKLLHTSASIINCTFYGNLVTSTQYGGGVYNEGVGNSSIKNCIFYNNSGVAFPHSSNSDAGITWNSTAPTITYTLMQSTPTGTGNITGNPLFINSSLPAGADGKLLTTDDGFGLQSTSLCVNTGNNIGTTVNDIINTTRIIGGTVDMGAYESSVIPAAPCITRLYVDASATSGGGTGGSSGSSWATAMNSLETALSYARTHSCVTEIWVKEGTYKPSQQYSPITLNDTTGNDRFKIFVMPSGVAVYGGFVGTETSIAARPTPFASSILSGDIGVVNDSSDNCYMISIYKNVSSATILNGFTITKEDGFGSVLTINRSPVVNIANGMGNSSSPTISNCIFTRNNGIEASAICDVVSNDAVSNIIITQCNFITNGMTDYPTGGAVTCFTQGGVSNPIITNCNFSNNKCIANIYNEATYYSSTCNPTISYCTFSNNNNETSIYNTARNGANLIANIHHNTFANNEGTSCGGISNGSRSFGSIEAHISNCSFTNNKAIGSSSGAIANSTAFSSRNNIDINDCSFTDNIGVYGGAIVSISSSNGINNTSVSNSIFLRDSAISEGGAVANISLNNSISTTVATNCKFINNYAGNGGAIFNGYFGIPRNDSSHITLDKCVFSGNTAIGNGGAVYNVAGSSDNNITNITNSIFENNTATSGAAIYNTSNTTVAPGVNDLAIANCTFNNNIGSSLTGSGIFNIGTSAVNFTSIKNSIIRNTALNNVLSTTLISNSNVEGAGGSGASWNASFGTDGGGNIDVNPLFTNASDADGADNIFVTADDGLKLLPTSPCINAGNNTGVSATDIIGATRIIGGTVDMGAYETPVIITHSFSSSAGTGGTISPSGLISVAAGSSQTYTITPNAGFCISNVVVDGISIGAVSTFTFTGVAASHTIAASFVASVTPTVTIVSSQNPICFGSSLTITATATNGGTAPMYNFYIDGIAQGATASNTFNISTLTVGSHNIYCVMTANNLCQTIATATSNIKVINVGSPTFLPSITGVTSGCVIGFTTRLYNAIGGGVWSCSNPSVATINSMGIVTSVANGICGITYTYTNNIGCVSTTSINYTVASIGTINQIEGPSDVCVGSSITLSNATTGGVWTSIAGRATVNVSGVVTGTNAGAAQIRYTVSNAFGCSAYVGKNVTVNAIPRVPSIVYAPGTINPQTCAGGTFCNGRTFTLVGTPIGGTWSTSNPAVITINSATGVANTVGGGAASITYTYSVSGCSNSRTISGVVLGSRGINGTLNDKPQTIDDFSMYPNPAKMFISLKVNSLIGAGSIVVTDLYGKQVKMQSLSMGTNTIDISRLSQGMYFVSMITSEGKITKKLVVE